ncbi:MAG: LacI family DNA-binding transcriptional regulator [Scrofimicrobium sp.]
MNRRQRKSASLGDVARLAGVSPQTASRVSTGSNLVTPKTEAKVRAAMEQLGYTPNQAARALRKGAYRAVGVVTQQLERTGESLTTAGIVDEAARRGYTVTVVQIGEPDTKALDIALSRLSVLPIDGLLMVRIGRVSVDRIKLPAHLPVVSLDSRLAGVYPTVIGDSPEGTAEIIRHLVSMGHSNIHHIMGASDSDSAVVRRDQFAKSVAEHGLPAGRIWQGDWSVESGYRAGTKIAKDDKVTAVFCANDEMAFGVVRALQDAGLRVPEDISVAGFDGTEMSEFSNPPLTTIRQDFRYIAEVAVGQLINEIEHGETLDLEPFVKPVTMIVRGSTAPPNPDRLKL